MLIVGIYRRSPNLETTFGFIWQNLNFSTYIFLSSFFSLFSLYESSLFSSLNFLSPPFMKEWILLWSKNSRRLWHSWGLVHSDSIIQFGLLYSFLLLLIAFLNWRFSFPIVDWEFDWLHINRLMYVIQLVKGCELNFRYEI